MKVRFAVFAVLLLAVIGFASPAEACEKCVSAGYNGWVKCSSGHSSGYQSCYGGFGSPCSLGDSCGGGGGGLEPLHPDSAAPIAPCLTCSGDEPAQGFVLRAEPAAVEALTGAASVKSLRAGRLE